jgi:hypothetical protein
MGLAGDIFARLTLQPLAEVYPERAACASKGQAQDERNIRS